MKKPESAVIALKNFRLKDFIAATNPLIQFAEKQALTKNRDVAVYTVNSHSSSFGLGLDFYRGISILEVRDTKVNLHTIENNYGPNLIVLDADQILAEAIEHNARIARVYSNKLEVDYYYDTLPRYYIPQTGHGKFLECLAVDRGVYDTTRKHLQRNKGVFCLIDFSNSELGNNDWHFKHWRELILKLSLGEGIPTCLISGFQSITSSYEHLVNQLSLDCKVATVKSLFDAVELLLTCRFFISFESELTHLAIALGVPSLIFYPGTIAKSTYTYRADYLKYIYAPLRSFDSRAVFLELRDVYQYYDSST